MALPVNLSTVTVTGRYVDVLGNPISGQVKFTPRAVLTDTVDNTIIINSTITVTLNASGEFSVTLVATDDTDALPVDFTYRVEEAFIGGRTFDITLPSSPSTIDLADKLPAVLSSGEGSLYVTVSQFNTLDGRVTTLEGSITTLQTQANNFYNSLNSTLSSAIAASSANVTIVNNLLRDLGNLEDNGASVNSLLLLKAS